MERKTEVRGKQKGGGGGLTHWFPLFPLHTGECAGFGPLRFVAGCDVSEGEESLESLGITTVNNFTVTQ